MLFSPKLIYLKQNILKTIGLYKLQTFRFSGLHATLRGG